MHVAVTDLDRSIRFYSAVFGARPTVIKDDYAKWALEDPRIHFAISNRGNRPGLDHVGIQTESEEELSTLHARLEAARISATPQQDAACCYARSDKYWTMDPQGIAWEAFHTVGSIPTFNETPGETAGRSCCVIPGITESGCC
jgi:catechol 2,3-dioxygenase-like lactoylglutathione lyase family enzyme